VAAALGIFASYAVNVSPVLLAKGAGDRATRLALYGLGNIRDDRFSRLLRTNAIKFKRPAEDPAAWFSLFLIHQNRCVLALRACGLGNL
jgi:double-strand break repair protein MRE11